ncbi:uncharacterized protein LOC100905733 [Galendromus occidentalis]|uniref:Uncharacterized protein LOC100905733 n=1 Tax=Galendromus occidentalis TaxID=34638 RepID=A0AAJ6QWP8_9ACAR|nr:uncharacterized protein LOC100905733 [Galendromus occidentalis]
MDVEGEGSEKEKERGEKERNASASSLWSRANSLRQSLRHRSHKHAQSTSVSVLIDDLPKGRKGLGDDVLRREWGSHRDLSRTRKAQSSALLAVSDASRQVVRRHSSKSRPGDHVLSTAEPALNKTPPLAVQEETRTILCIDKVSQELEYGLDFQENNSAASDSIRKQRFPQRTSNDLDDGQTGGSPLRKTQANPQRKLTKDSGYEASVCSEPDYVNALFLCGSASNSMLRRSQPSWDSPMAVSEPLSLPSGSYVGGLSCAGFGSLSSPGLNNAIQTSPSGPKCVGEHENAHRRFSPASVTYDTLASSKSKESLKYLGAKTSSCDLLKQSESMNSDRKTVASWLSRQQKQKTEADRTSPSKSYEDIYEEVGGSDSAQQERHLRSASDPLANQDDKSAWPNQNGVADRVTGDNSDSSTYIDSVGSELKWGDSYSDLSAFSVRSSNQSSGFESGQSTVADTGRVSPQSSLDGSTMMGGFGERVTSRYPLPAKEGVAHSAKIPSVERHCSESVLYFENQMKNLSSSTINISNNNNNNTKGTTVSSSSVNSHIPGEKIEEVDVQKSSLQHDPVDSTEDIGRPRDSLTRRAKLPEQDIKQIQKQAVLSYLRQRQEASVGAKPTQFRNEPPESAEKPTPIKPMAVKLLEDSSVPPELPPKLFKSSELLHGVVRRPKDSQQIEPPRNEKKKPPLPPPKTFKLNMQLKQTFYPTPPPIKEKPEKLRQRTRSNDSSLVMAKMVYIPLASPSEEQTPRDSAPCQAWNGGPTETSSSALPQPDAVKPPQTCGKPTPARPMKQDGDTQSVRRRFDDGYGTCLDDEDEASTTEPKDHSEKSILKPQQRKSDPNQAVPKGNPPKSKLSRDEADVKEEIRVNNLFESELKAKLEALKKTNELRKFTNYVSEVDHIAALVVNLSLRIGRTTANLNGAAEGAATYKAQLVQKLEKMELELEEARRLEANCEKRWASFGVHLSSFLGSGDLIERYLHFMKNRGDLLVKQRSIADRQQSTPRKP